MFTKTITLAGAELSSFLAAGGQTVNPNAATAVDTPVVTTTTPAVAQVAFPTVVTTPTPTTTATPTTTTTPTPTTTAIPTTTSTPVPVPTPSTRAAVVSVSSYKPASAAALSSAATSILSSSTTRPSSTLTPSTSARISSTAHATSSARVSSVRSIGANALSSVANKASASKGISGGGIAGIIIGLLLGFGLIGALVFFWRKRRNDRRAEALEEKHQRDLQNEKGMVRLEESEVKSPGAGGGFDFGNLPPIAAAPLNYDANNFTRSASPAQMEMGAAVLGIKRPFTPPPGHPAHPNYKQPPALDANRQMQQQQPQQPNLGMGPQGAQANMPRKPVPAMVAPAPMQRSLSSNNPFADPAGAQHVAPPLAHTTSPVISQKNEPTSQISRTEASPRASLDSFVAGDDSFGDDDGSVAATSAMQAKSELSPAPKAETVPIATTKPADIPVETTNTQPIRTKSVQEASDNWAARKAHLKNTLALQGASRPTSPAVEQSPFADPAPSIEHEIATLSPMDLNFSQEHADGGK